ncbi:MAG: efflux RND transporter periplasmic adaptor subunit [Burkholderiaceae bacterium]
MTATTDKPGWLSRLFWPLLVMLILIGSIAGFMALHKFKPRADVKPIERQVASVLAAKINIGSGGLPVTGNGLVRARTQVSLTAEVSARVIAVSPALVAGGSIRQGSVLIRLDDTAFRASLSQASADLNGAVSNLKLAEQSVKRTRELIDKGFLSRQTLDEQISAREQAQSRVARARAVSRSQKISLARTRILAPFDGRVLSAAINGGDTVQPGRELARVFDDNALEVAVSLTDDDMALIDNPWSNGQGKALATVMVDHGGKRYAWDAVVDRVEAAIDPATRTFNVVVRVLNPTAAGRAVDGPSVQGPPLLVGMYATVEIAGRDQGQYVTVPRDALRDGSTVWTIDDAGAVRIVKVDVLAESDQEVALAMGELTPKSLVITSDLKVVTEGMPVQVIGKPSPARQSSAPQPANTDRS